MHPTAFEQGVGVQEGSFHFKYRQRRTKVAGAFLSGEFQLTPARDMQPQFGICSTVNTPSSWQPMKYQTSNRSGLYDLVSLSNASSLKTKQKN